MKHWSLAATTAAIALFAGTAQAEVTAAQVWQNWQDMSKSFGQVLTTGSTATEGSTLVIKDLKAVTDKDGSHVESTVPEVRMTDKGDGTVEITMSDSYALSLTLPAAESDGTPKSLELTISQPGLVVTASGTPEATDYAFKGPKLDVTLAKLDGKTAAEQGINTATGSLTNLTGHYLLAGAEGAKTYDMTFAADSLAVNVDGKSPENGQAVTLTASVSALATQGKGSLTGMENKELADALKAGFASDVTVSYGTVSYAVSATDSSGPTKISGEAGAGSLQMAIDAARLMLATQSKGVKLAMSGPEIPVPELSLSYAESAFTLMMPVLKSDTPQDFAFLTKVVDLAVSNDIWGMLDPQGQLPHDPATLVIDTKGKAKLTADLVNESEMAALGEAAPGELDALDLNELHVKIAGAELTGNGSLTFDNSDKETFGGVPAPTGKVDLKLLGGNALLDKLVAMGLISQDDVMGFRMMLSMFTNQTGDDQLTSTLEFKDKHFFANGQQLQ